MTTVLDRPIKFGTNVTNMLTALSDHARVRAAERTDMAPEAIIDLLHTGRAVRLNNPELHHERRAYFLCFSPSNKQFFIAITKPADDPRKPGTLVTILTLEQYQADRGEVSFDYKCSAARLMLNRDDFRIFKAELAGVCQIPCAPAKRDIRAALYYFDAHHDRQRLLLGSTKVPLCFLTEHGLGSIHTHPAFWKSLAERVATAGLSAEVTIDRVEVWVKDNEPVVITLAQLQDGQLVATTTTNADKQEGTAQ